ncbi:hypothetical protein GQX74_011326 [Glossina fuscipes]|nr:hypothetical protein GQX74_011326 [Glossina fuscipes]
MVYYDLGSWSNGKRIAPRRGIIYNASRRIKIAPSNKTGGAARLLFGVLDSNYAEEIYKSPNELEPKPMKEARYEIVTRTRARRGQPKYIKNDQGKQNIEFPEGQQVLVQTKPSWMEATIKQQLRPISCCCTLSNKNKEKRPHPNQILNNRNQPLSSTLEDVSSY